MPSFDLTSIPSREERVVDEVMGDEAVLLLPDRREIKVLNELGARTWSLIDGNRSVIQIAEMISQEYEVDMETVLSDTLAFLNELRGLGLIASYPATRQPAGTNEYEQNPNS